MNWVRSVEARNLLLTMEVKLLDFVRECLRPAKQALGKRAGECKSGTVNSENASPRAPASNAQPHSYEPVAVPYSTKQHSREWFLWGLHEQFHMTCPSCGSNTKSRLAIIEPSELTEKREYCLTCDKFVDDDARLPGEDSE